MAADPEGGIRDLVDALGTAGAFTETGDDAAVAQEGPCRVLVVDDREDLRESLRGLLDASGDFEVTVADGGCSALARLESSPQDIVLLDLVMPDLSGLEVIDRALASGFDGHIIIVSGEPTFEHVQQALTRGAADFVRKPYEPEELLSTVARVRQRLALERRSRHMERHILRSETLHRFVVDSSPDLIYMLDREGRFRFVNRRVETLLGIPREELIGKDYRVLIPRSERNSAEFVFNERRVGDRATRDTELVLRSRIPRGGDQREHVAPVEITAVGIYAEEGERRSHVGTYGIARDISLRKRAEELIHFQTWHDQLTRLPNRTLFRDRTELALAQAPRSGDRVAVMFLDLDRFKVVNDTLGHSLGDRLLQAVATRLRGIVRSGDTLARFGGDEFCLLLPDVKAGADIGAFAAKLIAALEAPFEIDDHELYVGASIGIAVAPDAGDTAEALVRAADIAMYQIKNRGKNGFEFFHPDMVEQYDSHLVLERELRNALQRDELEPHYQPQVDLNSGKVIGVEALARWNHTERGLVNPDEFIPLAEETGLIVAVDRCIQRKACLDVARWRREGRVDVCLSLNVSAAQMESADFVDSMLEMIWDTGIGPRNVKLEITESVIMREMDQIVPRLRRLATEGVRIGIDDFGTGYSSLSYLQRFPVDTLKMDRSFVSDIRGTGVESSIVNAIIYMARGLGLDIIAEGVEDQGQAAYLKGQGCGQAQGYLFARPMSQQNAWDWLVGEGEHPAMRALIETPLAGVGATAH